MKFHHRESRELIRRVASGSSVLDGTAAWRVRNPGMRVYCKTGLIWVGGAPTNDPLVEVGSTLWVSAHDVSQDAGVSFPVENLIGTSALPLTIPTDAALAGKFITFQLAHPIVRGLFSSIQNGQQRGSWWVHAEWWAVPSVCEDEWQELRSQMGLSLELGDFLVLSGVT